MPRRLARHLARGAVVVAALAASACSKTTNGGGLEILLATNLATPGDFDTIHLQISQQTSASGDGGQWSSLFDNEFLVPGETTLPTSFSIAAGSSPDQIALVQVTALKNGRAVDLREAQVQVPSDRVAALTLIIAESCLGQVTTVSNIAVPTCPSGQSCQPATGTCGPTLIPGPLPTYTSKSLASIDASVGAFASHPHVDGGRDAGHDATVDSGRDSGHDAAIDVWSVAPADATLEAGDGGHDAPAEASDAGMDATRPPFTGICSDAGICLLAFGQTLASSIAVDTAHVYWTQAAMDGSVMRTDLDGGVPVTIVSGRFTPGFVATDGTSVYWADGVPGNIMKASIDGGNVRALAPTNTGASDIVVHGSTVYWTDGINPGRVMRVSANGGTPSTVGVSYWPNGLTVVDSGVYWTDRGGGINLPAPSIVKVASLDGGAATTLASFEGGVSTLTGIAVSATTVYWGDEGFHALFERALSGGATSELRLAGYPSNNPTAVFVDSKGVYWTDPGANNVVEYIGDGGPVVSFDGGAPTGLAVGSTRIYWVNASTGQIFSFLKL